MAVLPSGKAKVAPAIKDGGSAKKYADKKGGGVGGQVVEEEPKGETLSDGSERGNEEAGLIGQQHTMGETFSSCAEDEWFTP